MAWDMMLSWYTFIDPLKNIYSAVVGWSVIVDWTLVVDGIADFF